MFVKKLVLLLPSVLLLSLHASYHDRHVYYFKSSLPKEATYIPIYRVKIGAFSHLNNAKKMQKNTPKSYILKGEKYHNLYLGAYHDKAEAMRTLNVLQKHYHDAYLVTTYEIQKPIMIEEKEDFFKQAQAYFASGDYESALALYDKEMILHPNNHLAALEYARTLYMLGFYKQAREVFVNVLAQNPPAQVQHNIHLFLEKIENKLTTHSFTGTIMIGATYDDNLGYTTSSPTFNYGGLTLENDTNKTKGFYNTLNLLLSHHYQKEHFSWESSFYTYNEFQQQNNISALNLLHLSTAISKSYNNFKITLPVAISHTWFAQKRDTLSLMTQPSFIFKVSNKTQLALQTLYRHSKNETDDEKSYGTWGTSIITSSVFKQSSIQTKLGYEKDKKEEGERIDISKENFYAGATLGYDVLTDSQLFLRYLYLESHYSDSDPTLAYAREDKKNQLTLGMKQGISKKSALSLIYTYLNNHSNINSYSYKKNAYTLNYNYDF